MLYAVRFYDKPNHLDIRQAHGQAHVAWLDEHRDRILVAGALREAPGLPPVGGLWLVDAESKVDIEALLQSDPFWTHGLRERFDIHLWSKAFPDRQVSV